MAPPELDEETLGDKHRNYNKILREAEHSLADYDDTDLNKLLKIDLACQKKDVEYILNVLKCEDMLYVSRAIARSTWLVAENEYANIINPDYLQSNLFPNMTTKAKTKFKKHIRHNIKDESRAEQFYLNETNKEEVSKWLPHCSVAFIENHVEKHVKQFRSMKIRLFKRLCEKSVTIFEIITKNLEIYEKREYLQAVTFFLNTEVDKYLDAMEPTNRTYPKLNHKATNLIMKQSKNRITGSVENYITAIHIPTFVKYLSAEEIKEFLYAQTKKNFETYEYRNLRCLFQYNTLKHFVNRLPKNEQFDFVKRVCMRKENEVIEQEILSTDTADIRLKKICNRYNQKSYVWYQFAPFDHAFDEITKLISQNVETYEKRPMFSVLIKCTKYNPERIQTVLQYYTNKHKNDDTSAKVDFVTEIIDYISVSKCDEKTWNMLNTILKSMKIYEASSDSVNKYIVNFIIVYNVINDQETPKVIEEQFRFDTFQTHRSKMSEQQKSKLFNYLYEHLLSKLNAPITEQCDLRDSVFIVKNMLKLLQDWNKSLLDYPIILNKIKEFIKLKKENSWKTKLSSLYNINKSWRKHMFEESIELCSNEEVCLNALKHGPLLLERRKEAVDALKKDDKVSLQRLHSKLRIYWPHSIAQQWVNGYLSNIKETKVQNATVRGICAMLPHRQLLDMIEEYTPVRAKIDWKQIDENFLKIQGLLAKNMHRSRPQPPPDSILLYAKGDYLQYALPSLLAIFYNLKSPVARIYIPKLLDAPVSLQKHGIRFAFRRLDHEELKKVFLNCWNASKNPSIRAIIFKYTHTLLCNEKDDIKAASLWELLDLFIDNLTFTEDKDIYKLFERDVEQVPLNIRANYIVKSYNFIQTLIPNLPESDRSQYQWITSRLAEHSRILMETISSDFVKTIIQEYIKKFLDIDSNSIHYCDGILKVLSAYVLCCKSENEQIQKYENILLPLMKQSFDKWGEKAKGTCVIRQRFDQLLLRLAYDLKEYVAEKKLIIPIKMFTLILAELEKSLSLTEDYILITKWKLTVAFANLMQKHSTSEDNKDIAMEFGIFCLDELKKDIALHFPCIYILFSRCVKSLIDLITGEAKLEFYKSILSDNDFIQGYLSAIEIGSDNRAIDDYQPIWKQIVAHPSIEVKMHYYHKIEQKNII